MSRTHQVPPLHNVHVVTIAPNVPGPVAADRLAELGARVTTVLPPTGDPVQLIAPDLFDFLHRGQEVRTLDLKDEAARQEMEALLADADLLLTSHRPNALRRLGLDFSAVADRHPQLSQIDIIGHPGDHADLAGHDLTYQALNGLIAPGQMPTTLIADMATAERAVTAALAVLRVKDRDGVGAHMEVAISEAARTAAIPLNHGLTARDGPLGGGYPLYAVYPAAEGDVALAALEPQFRERTLRLLEIEAEADDLPQLAAELATKFACRSADHWEAWGQENDLPIAALREPLVPRAR